MAPRDLSGAYAEQPRLDPAARPSTYLLPVDDRTLTRAAMGRMACERLHVEPVEIPGGRSSFVAHPGPIADALDQVAS